METDATDRPSAEEEASTWWKDWRPRLPAVLSIAKGAHWRDARTWLYYTLFGGLLPFWGTALILLFIHRSQSIGQYFAKGELAVFCAGLLSSAIPVMRRRVKDAPVEHPEWFHFLALICIAVVLVLFASVTIARQLNLEGATEPPLLLNDTAILAASFLLFGVSVSMGFFVELINNIRMTPADVKAFEQRRESDLAKAFESARRTQSE